MLEYAVYIIFLIGLLCMIVPKRFRSLIRAIALIGASLTFLYGVLNFISPTYETVSSFFSYNSFNGFITLACTFFCFCIVCFSINYAEFIPEINLYYGLIFWCVSFSLFAVYSANLVALLVFWGLSGMALYLLANLMPQASNAAKKSFIFVGGSDAFLVLGIAILWMLTGSFDIFNIRIRLADGSALAKVSFICFSIAALTKAGAMPFHSWIPDFAENVPMTLTAFLPAALDKLLGIFLLVLVTNRLFILDAPMSLLLLIVASITIITAVCMAMVQSNIKRMLAYCAVSQVGYIILGIASGTPLGIAGGMFHMLNHAVYKSGLFLTGASIEHRNGTTSLSKLGGLSKFMPITFGVALVTGFAMSGIPPFSAFASKWMIYQSLIQQYLNPALPITEKMLFLLFLITAMFGSAMTLAVFAKFIHSVFLGQPSESPQTPAAEIKEVKLPMLIPMILLAFLSILFGVLPNSIPLKLFIYPSLESLNIPVPKFIGLWQPGTATALIVGALFIGILIFLAGNITFKTDKPFMGGEDLPPDAKASGPEFYKTITDMWFFNKVYGFAEKKYFDIYDQITKLVLGLGRFLSFVHTGSLHTYLLLFLLGFATIILALR